MATNRKQPRKPDSGPVEVPSAVSAKINAARAAIMPEMRALQEAAMREIGEDDGRAAVGLWTMLAADFALTVWRFTCHRNPNADPGTVATSLLEAIGRNMFSIHNAQLASEAEQAKGQTKQ
jgi:hypothetical protein